MLCDKKAFLHSEVVFQKESIIVIGMAMHQDQVSGLTFSKIVV